MWLRRLLKLYPREHNHEYGEEMWEAVCHRWQQAGGGLAATVRAGLDLIAGAIGVRWDRLRRGMMGIGTGVARGWVLDTRFVLRSLWKSRGYVATALTVLACAVAANATVYSYAQGTLLADAPYPDPEAVLVVWGSNVENGQLRDVISGPTFVDLQEEVAAFQALAAFHYDGTYREVDGHPEVLGVVEVSSRFFDVVMAEPAMGRLFGEEDRFSGGAENVVITYGFWRDALGATPDIIGSPLVLEGEPRTVIGVLPDDFRFIAPAPVFLPLHDDELLADSRTRIHYNLLGRMAPGSTLSDVSRELRVAAGRLVDEFPDYEGWSFRAERLHDVSVEAIRPAILILTVTVALVLLVALTNLTTLFRVRASARRDEIAVRAALGAGRIRLARVLALETVLLAVGGAALGLAVTPWILSRAAEMVPMWVAIPESAARVPVVHAVLSFKVVALAMVSAVGGALLLTLPSLFSLLADRSNRGPSGSRVHGGLAGIRLLVGTELAITTLLCAGAVLLVRSLDHLLSTEVGVEAEGLLTAEFGDAWGLEPAARAVYFQEVVAAVQSIPGVERAGVIDYVDFRAEDDFARIEFLDRELQARTSVREEWRRIDEGLFETAGMTLRSGRPFTRADMVGTPRVAIVNEAFARRHYDQGNALDQYLSTHDEAYRDLRIVGIVGDIHSLGPAVAPPPMLYVPNQGSARGTLGLYARVQGEPMALAPSIRTAIWSVDPSQPIIDFQPMTSLVDSWVAVPRAARTLVLLLAGLAWLLSVVGVFGVASYAVRTRRSELGIRMALGASPSRLEADQLRAITPVILLGVGAGLVVALFVGRAAEALLFGVRAADPLSLTAAVLATSLAALAATYIPARQAGRIDPTRVMSPDAE